MPRVTVTAQSLSNVAITSPAGGSTLSGSVTVSAVAGTPDLVGVQFKVSGVDLGPEITTGACSTVWNTAAGPDGAYTLTVVGRDVSGILSTSSPVSVTVLNAAPPPPPPGPPPPPPQPPSDAGPQITAVTTANMASTSVAIRWVTNQPSSSEVDFGRTTAYGSTSSDPTLVTEHVRILIGLSPATTYQFRVRSMNAQNQTGTSPNFAFTTAEPLPDPGPEPAPVPPPVSGVGGRDSARDQKKIRLDGEPPPQGVSRSEIRPKPAVEAPQAAAAPAQPLRTAACSTPDPFGHLPGLVGVCRRGSWVPAKRSGG
jgi:hypothetical protein